MPLKFTNVGNPQFYEGITELNTKLEEINNMIISENYDPDKVYGEIQNAEAMLNNAWQYGSISQSLMRKYKRKVERIYDKALKRQKKVFKLSQKITDLDGEINSSHLTLYSNKLQYSFIFFLSILILFITIRAFLFKSGTIVENIMFIVIIGYSVYLLISYLF